MDPSLHAHPTAARPAARAVRLRLRRTC